MPARQRGPVFHDVAGGPEDAPLVERPGHVVVGAEDVEIAGLEALDHEIDRLLRRPGGGRLFTAAVAGKAGEDEAGDQQVRADLAAGRIPQLVLQRFGESLHAGLRHIVGGIAGRRGDALLGARVDDEARPPAFDHMRRKHLRTVDDTPQIDGEDALPILRRTEHLAARLDAGIVHQDVGAAEAPLHGAFQTRDVLDAADVHGRRHDIGGAAGRCR